MTPDDIRKKVDSLIVERGLSLAQASLAIGKNVAYLHQYINKGSPVRLPEIQRKKLAALLNVSEQELSDTPINISEDIDENLLIKIISKIEALEAASDYEYTATDKARLVKLMYIKIKGLPEKEQDEEASKIIDIYDYMKKAN